MSQFGKLSTIDFWKGLVMFVIATVLMTVGNLTTLTSLTWQQVLGVALTATASYLLKNLGTTEDGKVLGFGGK
jgi:hypothetical protein